MTAPDFHSTAIAFDDLLNFVALVMVGDEMTREIVHAFDACTGTLVETVHAADFPTHCLGEADRHEYSRNMLASIAARHRRLVGTAG